MAITVNIEKDLGSFQLKVAFSAGNETVSLLGASGSGKSMTLRCIAGMEKPDRGKIVVDGVTLFDSESGIDLAPQKRYTGLMFQNYALFPHMTVLQNIRAGARRETDPAKREQMIAQTISRFGLSELEGRSPGQLSGGQQQRVALARILVSNPNILLLDEPFSALDSHLRFHMEQEVGEILRAFGKTVILVSHDRDEVFRLSDRIVVMDQGAVAAQGLKEKVFSNPVTRAAAILTGYTNISAVRRTGPDRVEAVDWGMALTLSRAVEGDTDAVAVRAQDIRTGSGENTVLCRTVGEMENPFSYTVLLTPADWPDAVPLTWELDKASWEALRGDTVTVHIPAERIIQLKGRVE